MRRKITKRLISMMMAVVMLLSIFPFSAFADEVTASDLDGHWAEQVMQEWMGYGIVAGYEDGTVRPDRSITRAEMTAMLDRVMDYQTKATNPFTDLDDAWYTEVVLKANAAGVISGYPDNTVRPNATISRQEAVAMFARVLSLDTTNAPEADFTDNDAVADWAKDAVNAMAAAGYIHGSDGQFRPDAGITRAEVITIFNNIFDKLYAKAGTYTGDVNGSAVVSADGVTLENMHIKGDLIIAEGVGDGHVELDNVTVDGQLIVRGGGENSIIIKGDSQIGTISIERKDGAVRVVVENGADVSMIAVNDGSNGVKIEGNVTTLNVANIDADVTVDGTIDNLNVSGPRATVTISGSVENIAVEDNAHDATLVISKDTTVDTLKTSAENTTIVTNGDIDTVTIGTSAPGATITVESTGAIGNVTTSASGTTVEGEGSVDKVEVTENASDTTITTSGTTIENNSDEAVSIGNGDTIASGTTGTTPDGEADEPEQPSTPTPQPTPEPDPTPDPEPTTFTVTFQKTDGTTIATQTVTENGTASAPTENLPVVEDGQKLTWYNGTEPFDFSTAITSNLTLIAVVGSDDFTAGNGSESYPYLISTAQELANVGLLSDADNHFELTNDIDMSNTPASATDSYGDSGDIYQLYGTLNGNGHTIIAKENTAGTFLYATNATINNLTFNITNHPAVTNAYNTTFNNVNVTGNMEVSNNLGAFVLYAVPESGEVSLTFNNCTANVEMVGGGASNNYNAVFVGYAYGGGAKTTLTFTNCVNEGNLTCGKAAMFLGNNSTNGGLVTLNVTDCVNKGSIRSTYTDASYSWNHFVATGAHANNTVVLNGTTLTSATAGSVTTEGSGEFVQGPNDGSLALQKNDDNTFTITPASTAGVDHYVVTMSLYAKLLNGDGSLEGGTQIVSVSETVPATSVNESYTTTLKLLPFVDEDWITTNTGATSKTEGENTVYTLDGSSYYYFGSKAETHASLQGTPTTPTMISVSAYDASGNLLCSASLSK